MSIESAANLYVDHREKLLVPSSISQLPQCSRKALESSRRYSTYALFDVSGHFLSALGRTRNKKLRRFDSERALDDARSKIKARFIVQEGDTTRFFISSKKGAQEVSSLAAMNPVNWSHLLKTALLGYLSSGFVPGAAATTFTPSNPVAVSTSIYGQLGTCSLLQTNNTHISFAWQDDAKILHRVLDLSKNQITPQTFLISSDINWSPVQIPRDDGYLIFWNWADLGTRWVLQEFDQSHQPVGIKKTPFSPYDAERKQEVYPFVLPNGQTPIVWMDWENIPYSAYHAIFDPASLTFPVAPTKISTIALNQRNPNLILRNSGYVAVFSIDGEIKQQLYANSGAKVGNETSVNSNSTGNQQFAHGINLSDGSYLVAWANINTTTYEIEGYYYRRFYANGLPKDTTDQVLIEGNLGRTDYGKEVIAFARAPDESFSIFVLTDQNLLHQKFSASGSPDGGLEPLESSNTLSVGGASFENGFGICWTNASGMYSQLWEAVAPSSTSTSIAPTPSLASGTTHSTSTSSLVPTSTRSQTTTTSITSVPTSSIDQSTSATVGSTATSSRMKSSSSSSSLVLIPSSSSNPISPSKADQEKSKNWGLVIVVSLVVCISVAICVAIIGFIILRRRKKEGGSEVELAATTEQSSNPGVTIYASLHEETPLEIDGKTAGNGEEPNYQNLSDCRPQANGRTSGNGEEPNYQNLSACKTQANGSSSEEEPDYRPLSEFQEY